MPMAQGTWWFVGALAVVASASVAVRREGLWRVRVGGQLLAVLLWAIFAINAFAVVHINENGTRQLLSNPAMGYLGAVVGLGLAADLLLVVLELLGDDGETLG